MEREDRYSRYRWIIVVLLFLATMNNYANRISLSVVVSEIKGDLGLSDIQYSYVLSAFQFAYMFGMLLAGAFIDRVGTKLGYLVLIAGWSVSGAMHALSGSVFSLAFWRGCLGLTEAGNFPAAVKAVAEWFPVRERSFATALFNSGPHVAMVAGPPLIAAMTLRFGWKTALLILGLSGMLLVVFWPFLYRKPASGLVAEAASVLQNDGDSGYRWRDLLVYRETWAIMSIKFLTDAVWWFYIFWLPNYLNSQRGFDLKGIAIAVPVIYFIAVLLGIIGGWLPGWFMGRGWSALRARKTAMFLCAVCLPFTIFAVWAENVWVTIALVSLACGAHSGWSNNTFTLVSDCFPSKAVASVTGLGGFSGALGGFLISTFAVGHIVTWFGYTPIFIIMGLLHPLGMLCILLLVREKRCG